MRKTHVICHGIVAVACCTFAALAIAGSGDDEAVAKARADYARAMQGHDVGLQNAMKVELSVQLARAREHARQQKKIKKRPGGAQQGSPGKSRGEESAQP